MSLAGMTAQYWHVFGYRTNWGDVPTWAATIAAVIAGIFTALLLRVEFMRDNRAEERDLRQQGDHVTIWRRPQLSLEAPPGAASGSIERIPRYYWHVTISNANDLPVYELELVTHLIAKDRSRLQAVGYFDLGTIPERETWKMLTLSQNLNEWHNDDYLLEPVWALRFKDSSGNRFVRWSSGGLYPESDSLNYPQIRGLRRLDRPARMDKQKM